jgi:quercetin dioxygenase-like cupin family protein
MDDAAFEAALRADGYADVVRKHFAAAPTCDEHTHPYDVRALVLGGEITLTVDGVATPYRAGEVFTMANGCRHAEGVAVGGADVLLGRRHTADG